LGIETLEDRIVPDAVPSFPFLPPTLPAASLSASVNSSLNGNFSMASANSTVFDLGALSSSLAQAATFLANMTVASTLPGGMSVPPILGSNPSLQLDFAFALFLQELNMIGGVGSGVASNLSGTFGSGMGLPPGNS
jgi:hypothetical protein